MAEFISMSKQNLLALVNAGQAVAGNVYFSNDTGETFLAMTGNPNSNPALAPLSSLILTGRYSLQGPPGADGVQGEVGPAGPQGEPGISLAQVIATQIALG